MPSLDDTEVAILLTLHDEATSTGRLLGPERLALKFKPRLTRRITDIALRHLRQCEYVEASFDNPNQSGYAITRLGMSLVSSGYERVADRGDAHWVQKDGERPIRPLLSDVQSEKASVFSEGWTGLSTGFTLAEDKRVALVRELDRIEQKTAGLNLSQHDRSQIRAYVVAARFLAEAPDPPADVIWELIGRANSFAGVLSLFVSVVALFK